MAKEQQKMQMENAQAQQQMQLQGQQAQMGMQAQMQGQQGQQQVAASPEEEQAIMDLLSGDDVADIPGEEQADTEGIFAEDEESTDAGDVAGFALGEEVQVGEIDPPLAYEMAETIRSDGEELVLHLESIGYGRDESLAVIKNLSCELDLYCIGQ